MKLINSSFNKETGQSFVTLADKYGLYTGKAKAHPDQRNRVSELAGCCIAEGRAQIKCLKDERRRTKIALKAIQDLEKDIMSNCPAALDPLISKRIYLATKRYTKQIEQIDSFIAEIEKDLDNYMKTRQKLLDNLKGQNN